MSQAPALAGIAHPTHAWLRPLRIALVPGPNPGPLTHVVLRALRHRLPRVGHTVQDAVGPETDAILTSAAFGVPVPWRQALMFSARRRYRLTHSPTVFTLLAVSRQRLDEVLDYLRAALAKQPPRPEDFAFPGLAPQAYHVLIEQGLRGGPMLALVRLLQSQAMSIRIVLVEGEATPRAAYYFDLVGAHPRVEALDVEHFYEDMALRLATAVCTSEVTDHQIDARPISLDTWRHLQTPPAMLTAARELGLRRFFTEMVRVADLVHVPALADAVASQYSEGCFATWDSALGALVATVTGSARPVDKGQIDENDLAVISGLRDDGRGAIVRQVEGKRNDSPSSESVEMMAMDRRLPSITLNGRRAPAARVPVVRSKLHGHRGVASYDPACVEYVPLDPAFYHYPVSCGTEAQAHGVEDAFARSTALRNPEDPRTIAFTVLPGHGVVMVEKWVAGKAPFQELWEAMDDGRIQIENEIPQGPMGYGGDSGGRRILIHQGT